MKKSTSPPRVRLAQNLRRLIDMQDLTVYQVAEAAKIMPKTIYSMLKASFDPRLSSVEKVAGVFGLQVWQILATDMDSKPAEELEVLRLLEAYSEADEGGRKTILQVASIAAQKTPGSLKS